MKKIIFKLIALCLVTVSALSMFACGGGSSTSASTVEINVLNKGYGVEWLNKIIEAYNKKGGEFNAKLVTTTSSSSKFIEEIKSGPSANTIDLYVTIQSNYYRDLIADGRNVVNGYDCVFADLSDVYSAPLADYDNKSLLEMMPQYYVDAMTTKDGKKYTLPWAMGFEGMLCNTSLMKQYNFEVPNTTEEMIALFDKIKVVNNGTYATATVADVTMPVYPLYYARENNYSMYAWLCWWSQYEGMDNYYNFLEGKDANGNYSYNIFAQEGRIEALNVIERVLNQDNGYTNKNSLSFQVSQQYFLDGLSFFNFNGDWVEREARANESIGNIEFIKTPIISSIIKKTPTISDDKTLSAVISAIDKGESSYAGVSTEDFALIKSARELQCTEGEQHIICVPSYSNNIAGAKDFIKFMLSNEGQNIEMQYSCGNAVPFDRDFTKYACYNGLSAFAKSKLSLWKTSQFTGRKYNTPMTFDGGLRVFREDVWPELAFGTDVAKNKKTVEEYVLEDLEYYKGQWSTMTKNAGVI